MTTHYLACDLGADSGRLMLGTLAGGRLTLEEAHRFTNAPIKSGGSMHWDWEGLWGELKKGLAKVAERRLPVSSVSCDSWGVDYVLLDGQGRVMPPVHHYRDPRCQRGVERVRARVAWETVFAETGIQFMPLNTIYQLAAEEPGRLASAHRLLGIGDAFNYFLSGAAKTEASLASTTQLYNPLERTWSRRLLEALEIPAGLWTEIVPSGTRLGFMDEGLSRETGLPRIEVIASCSHDTGAAVAAVPAGGGSWAYLSSGTWSLIGVELPAPIINDQCRDLNLTNEIGYGGTVRLLKNIIGLWLVQECRRAWSKAGREYSFIELEELARSAPPFRSLIDPADARFLSPDDMPEKIAAQCRERGQPAPSDPGATIRAVYESLALFYRHTLRRIEQLIGRRIERMHIVGGGSKDGTLNQFTANALGIPVVAGPAEATAAGNLLIQAIALGHLPSLAAAREVVRQSLTGRTYLPEEAEAWEAAYRRFERLVAPV
ncbi:MAG TPA: rhamnulokinase family protein [Candidatus Paceibacterota bacterium]|nr:rhamnulokinase family protein [Verrucomicrobiota bacterium]HRZ46639.1 rhamnulokinase family protein [Candidatus Paceibacterota bacterium]